MPLHFTASKRPFTVAQQKAIQSLFALFPARFQAANVYVTAVSERDWKHGNFRGWTDSSGNVNLKSPQWTQVRGLAIHELAHAYRYIMLSPAQFAAWEVFWTKHKGELGSDYAKTNAEEGLAELLVGVLKPGLPGYSRPSAVALEYGRSLLK